MRIQSPSRSSGDLSGNLTHSFELFLQSRWKTVKISWSQVVDPRLVETRGLMIKIPKYYPVASPSNNQKVHELQPSPHSKCCFSNPSPESHQGVWIFWAWGARSSCSAKSLQSCPTLCYPTDGRPPGSPVPGILQARTLEWVAISFSNAGKWKVKGKSLSRVRLLATLCSAAYQAPPSMGFSRQEYWSGVPLPSPLSALQIKVVVFFAKWCL